MVTACKAYITDGGTNHVWDQETPIVLTKIQVCISIFIFIKLLPSGPIFFFFFTFFIPALL